MKSLPIKNTSFSCVCIFVSVKLQVMYWNGSTSVHKLHVSGKKNVSSLFRWFIQIFDSINDANSLRFVLSSQQSKSAAVVTHFAHNDLIFISWSEKRPFCCSDQ